MAAADTAAMESPQLAPEPSRADRWPWLVLVAAWAAMYLPTYWWASQSLWQSEDHGHGPIILAVVAWLLWQARDRLLSLPDMRFDALGWPVFVAGLLLYALGRAFSISIFELGSQVFVLAGVLLLLKAWPGLRAAWFAVFFLVFTIPLPGMLVDAATGSLKQWISIIVTEGLHAAGYPMARTGVMLTIGQYQLLVADACSGLHSMFSLSALGTLFMFVMARRSVLHNVLMLVAILPIAFAANVVRVTTLVLVTYYLGDEAGQGFLHGAAGIVLLIVALLILFGFDTLLSHLIRERPAAAGAPSQARSDSAN
jgi:exosortase B